MTLNGVIALILRFALNFIALHAAYVTVVEDRPIISAKSSPSSSLLFWPKLTHPAVRSLCDTAELLVCWLGHLTRKNSSPYDLYCVGGTLSLTQSINQSELLVQDWGHGVANLYSVIGLVTSPI